ncbi:MAG: gliding motility-associated C-terminal domain-containing protein [Taibaiella sp.]|nr:gliding motility-associated C-terminal domain-containing protein [Taibaiella sp.]
MKKAYLRSLILLLLIFSVSSSFANHIVGADLFYTHVSGNRYKITFIAYADCGPASATAFALLPSARPQICIYNAGSLVGNISLTIDTPNTPLAGLEITPVCPADTDATQCTNTAYSIPGIKKFVYTGIYNLPYTSAFWRFIFDGGMGTSIAGRATAITNITTGSVIQLIDTLDNRYHNNSSPALTIVPTPFFCLNNYDSYNPGAIDPDSDSLRFNLVAATNGTNNCSAIGGSVSYVGGYSATNPVAASAGTFFFNNATGQFDFFPNITQRSLVVYNVVEYRNDTFVGTSQREMTFLVLTCTSPPPTGSMTGSSAGTVLDSTHFAVCTGTGAFNVTLTPSAADTSNLIYVTATGLPTGATFTTVDDSTNHPVCTFSWTTTGVPTGSYTFYVTFKDNSCPVSGIRTNAYTITIAPNPTVDGGSNVTICAGSSATLTGSGAATYTWSPGATLSCTACTSTVASPATTTLYTVSGFTTFGCSGTDTVRVFVNPLPSAITGTTAICSGTTTTLADATGGGSWATSSAAIASINSATGVVTGVSGGTATITYTLPTGCYDTIAFTVNPTPGAIGGPAAVCVGSNITLTNGSAGGTWTSSNSSIASINSSTGVLTGVTTGTVTITYTLAAGCFVTTTITVNPLPAAITATTSICAGTSTTLSDATSGGTWSSSAIGIATIGTTTGVLTGVSGGSATISYTLSTGCYAITSVTINPAPAPIAGPVSVCLGSSVTVTDATGGGSWSSSNAGVATIDASSGVITSVATGTAIITYILATGCLDTANITVNPLPASIGGPTVVCVPATITITDATSGGTWISASAGIASVTSGSGVVTGVSAGTTTMTYTLTTGCYTTSTITVNPLPVAGTISGPTTVCVGATISLSETVTGGTWSTTNATATISSAGVVTGVSAGTDTVKYAVTNSCGTIYATYIINVIAFPTAGTLSGPSSVCEFASITLTPTITGGTWSTSASSTAVVSGGVVTGVAAGSVLISYAVSNSCGTAYVTKSITVDPVPIVVVTPALPDYCIGGNITLNAAGAVTYTWTPGAALSATTGATVVANPGSTATYSVTGTSSNGCFSTTTTTVVVHPLPVLTMPNVTMCSGTSSILTVSGANTYIWSPATTLSSSAGNSVIATPTDTITYNITGTDIYGCVNTTSVTVNVNPVPMAPAVTTPVKYCMTATAVPLTASGTSLLWYNSATGGTGSTTAPAPSTAAVGNTNYYVTQTVNGCESPRSEILVIVNQNAITDFEYTIHYGCTFDTVIFTNRSQYTSAQEWTFGDGSMMDTTRNPVHYYLPAHVPTNYIVKLHGYNSICFDDSTIKILTLTPNPTPPPVITSITADQTIEFGSSVQLEALGAYIYLWKPNDGTLNNPNINNPVATPTVTTTYVVVGYDKTGCIDSAKVTVTVNFNDVDNIPTGFTPNGDGQNDVFRLSHLKYGKLVELSVYNRWGQLVFHTTDINKGWDGSFEGAPQDMGVYNYLLITSHTDGKNTVYKGNITLLR